VRDDNARHNLNSDSLFPQRLLLAQIRFLRRNNLAGAAIAIHGTGNAIGSLIQLCSIADD
jgi:hypothetical protein